MIIAFFCNNVNDVPPTENFIISRYGKNLNIFPEEIIKISALWHYALERKGECGGLYIEKLYKYDALCLRTKQGKVLIRFPFYRDLLNDRLIILLGFCKKDGYKKRDKEARAIERKLDEAQKYYDEYHIDKSRYKTTRLLNDILMK